MSLAVQLTILFACSIHRILQWHSWLGCMLAVCFPSKEQSPGTSLPQPVAAERTITGVFVEPLPSCKANVSEKHAVRWGIACLYELSCCKCWVQPFVALLVHAQCAACSSMRVLSSLPHYHSWSHGACPAAKWLLQVTCMAVQSRLLLLRVVVPSWNLPPSSAHPHSPLLPAPHCSCFFPAGCSQQAGECCSTSSTLLFALQPGQPSPGLKA